MSYNSQRSSFRDQRDQRNPRNDRRHENNPRNQYSNYKPSYSSNQPRQNYQQNYQQNHQQNYQQNHQQNYQQNYQQNHRQNQNYQLNHQLNYQQNSQRNPRQTNQDHLQVWMGDLDPNWSENDILQIWNDHGLKPVSVKILKSDTNNKPPYCFVNFSSTQEVNDAIERQGSAISGTNFRFKLNRASERGNRTGQRPLSSSSYGNSRIQGDQYSSKDRSFEHTAHVERGFQDQLSLFIGDLASTVSERDLHEELNSRFPAQVKLVKVITDQNGQSKGYGFAKLQNSQAVKRALREMNGLLIHGKNIRVGPTKGTGSGSVTDTSARMGPPVVLPQVHPAMSPFTDPENVTISVNGLHGRFSHDDVRSVFSSFGEIDHISIVDDGKRANVTFCIRSLALMAILALNRVDLQGYRLGVNWGKDSSFPRKEGPRYGEFNAYTSDHQIGETRRGEKSEPLQISELNRQFGQTRAREAVVFDY